jgi:hypothetical protein
VPAASAGGRRPSRNRADRPAGSGGRRSQRWSRGGARFSLLCHRPVSDHTTAHLEQGITQLTAMTGSTPAARSMTTWPGPGRCPEVGGPGAG